MRCSEPLRTTTVVRRPPAETCNGPARRGEPPVIGWRVRLALIVLMVMPVMSGYDAMSAAPERSALTVVARRPELAWPNEAYRVQWEEAHVPPEVAANMVLAVPVTLQNSGNRAWPASLVFLAYHWFRDQKLVVWDGERTRLPRDVRAGGRATLAVRVKTPAEPGAYTLQLTLVHENVTWFENMGASMVIRPIVVRTTASAD
jgi:hypothetical protein